MSKQKTRFDGLDVLAMTSHLQQTLVGQKVVNIYDGETYGGSSSNGNVLLFKLAHTGSGAAAAAEDGTSSNSNKSVLLMESGIRFHVTKHMENQHTSQPGPFAMKLRKHIRGTRLEGVRQLGNLDRVVDFRFGSGDRAHHVILELYASGNVILTDSTYEIKALLRTHDYEGSSSRGAGNVEANPSDDGRVRVAVREIYPVTYATSMGNELESMCSASCEHLDIDKYEQLLMDEVNSYQEYLEEKRLTQQKKGKKKSKKDENSLTIKTFLLRKNSGFHHYGPSLIEHCIREAGLDPHMPLILPQLLKKESLTSLLEKLKVEGGICLRNLETSMNKRRDDEKSSIDTVGGYVLYHPKNEKESTVSQTGYDTHADKIFREFQPHLLHQHKDIPHLGYHSFSDAVDEFFSLIDGQKQLQKAESAEKQAKEKLNKIRLDQEKRIEGLEKEQAIMQRQATLVEIYASDVDNALLVINSALDSGMDWEDLERLVKYEKEENQNPIAMIIKGFNFEDNLVILTLPDPDSEDDLGNVGYVNVSVSRLLSAHANAREMFARNRQAKQKAEKTIEASLKALKAAEATAMKQLQESKSKKDKLLSNSSRKVFWFEKFRWCVTSNNYLVIGKVYHSLKTYIVSKANHVLGGRDAQQNEILVKRYLRPGDAYLHADVHGASSCVLRAKRRRMPDGSTQVIPLPDIALREAGTFTICHSSAWASKMVTSAFWVEAHQVSKSAPTGEYLTVGSFMIRGKKNFLPPSQLEMGLAVLFRLGDDESINRHVNDRRDLSVLMEEQDSYNKDTLASTKSINIEELKIDVEEEEETYGILNDDVLPTPTYDHFELDDRTNAKVNIENESLPKDLAGDIEGVEEMDSSSEIGIIKEENDKTLEGNTAPQKSKGRKGLSVRDRKLIKKYGSLEAAEQATKKRIEEEEKLKARKAAKAVAKDLVASEQQKIKQVRGKKGKKKKQQMKYAEQDDEDRELALAALQGGISKRKIIKGSSQVIAKTQTQKEAASATAALLIKDTDALSKKLDESVMRILEECIMVRDKSASEETVFVAKWSKFDGDTLERLMELQPLDAQRAAAQRLLFLTKSTRVDNFSASLAGIIRTISTYGYENMVGEPDVDKEGKQRKTKAEKEAEKEAWRTLLAEDGILDVDDANVDTAVDDTAELLKLTGKPLKEDTLLHAIPFCAPYQSLSQYKYRIKLTPGSQKRGKASKQCVEMLQSIAKENSRERDFIKSLGDNEWVQVMLGDVKISAPGASKAAKKQKQSKKKKK